mmetsp:Transcript_16053/g.36732  ORF Transcript_16053/g.36732 Transcript_16053/m.36732 type:complete len:233 (+) Transcript_16053:464-1162(+)
MAVPTAKMLSYLSVEREASDGTDESRLPEPDIPETNPASIPPSRAYAPQSQDAVDWSFSRPPAASKEVLPPDQLGFQEPMAFLVASRTPVSSAVRAAAPNCGASVAEMARKETSAAAFVAAASSLGVASVIGASQIAFLTSAAILVDSAVLAFFQNVERWAAMPSSCWVSSVVYFFCAAASSFSKTTLAWWYASGGALLPTTSETASRAAALAAASVSARAALAAAVPQPAF